MYEFKRIAARMGMLGALAGLEAGCAEEKQAPVCDAQPIHIEKFLVIEEKNPDIISIPECPSSTTEVVQNQIEVGVPKSATETEASWKVENRKQEYASTLYDMLESLRVYKYEQKEEKISQEVAEVSNLAWKEKAWEAVQTHQEWDDTTVAEFIFSEITDALPSAELRNYAMTHPAFLSSLKEIFSYAAKQISDLQLDVRLGHRYEGEVRHDLTKEEREEAESDIRFFRSLQGKIAPIIKDAFLNK